MRKFMPFLALIILIGQAFAEPPKVPIKNVAVVETQIDEASGAASEMSKAEVRVITDEIRREAVNNLPRDRFSVMTAETVQSMGSAVLEECAEENCVISLGIKIGADYIVRGIISKFRDNYTLAVEMYETDYGMLVATASQVRTPNLDELLDKTTGACAAMYKKFLEGSSQASAQQTAALPKPEAVVPVADVRVQGDGGALKSGRNYDYYFALRGFMVLESAYGVFRYVGGNVEFGAIWRNNVFFGGDFSLASHPSHGTFSGHYGGLGLDLGHLYHLSPGLKLVYGGSAGLWIETDGAYFLGPFVKLRWNSIELSNRLLYRREDIFSTQFSIGVNIEGSKRHSR